MRYDDPTVRPLIDLEGLKQWRDGRTAATRQLETRVRPLPLPRSVPAPAWASRDAIDARSRRARSRPRRASVAASARSRRSTWTRSCAFTALHRRSPCTCAHGPARGVTASSRVGCRRFAPPPSRRVRRSSPCCGAATRSAGAGAARSAPATRSTAESSTGRHSVGGWPRAAHSSRRACRRSRSRSIDRDEIWADDRAATLPRRPRPRSGIRRPRSRGTRRARTLERSRTRVVQILTYLIENENGGARRPGEVLRAGAPALPRGRCSSSRSRPPTRHGTSRCSRVGHCSRATRSDCRRSVARRR